ncbi:uncharacterized protein [Arachis hypogaea]|uniref:uncharacterized protein n=1 Tax=Arachis hypogaea TaxID=3818 RepID=UPI003B2120C0
MPIIFDVDQSYISPYLSLTVDNGGKIHASVKKAFVSRFVNLLEEGISYQIRYFGVGLNKGYFKTTHHEYVVNLNQRTDVHRLPESSSIPRYGFKFVSFDTLNAPGYDCTYLVDVVGYLAGIGNEKTLEKDGKSTKYTVIELEIDDGKIMECALFGNYAHELNAFLGSGNKDGAVVVLQFVRVKLFNEKIVLQNSMYGTKMFFNLEDTTVIQFKNSFVRFEESRGNIGGIPNEAAFLKIYQGKTIEQLKEFETNSICIVLATISHIMDTPDWWYGQCECNRSTYAFTKTFKCSSCGRLLLSITPRYRIKLGVIDDSDCACFVVFDKEAKQVLGKSCNLLLEFSNEVAANDESELLENAITPTKRLCSESEESKVEGNSSDGSNDVHFQSVLSNITNGLNTGEKERCSNISDISNSGITCEAYDSPCHQTSQQQFQQTSNNIDQLQSQHSLEYSNRIRLQRDARLNRKIMLLQKRHGASTSNSNLDTKELEEVCIAEKGRHLRQRKTFLKELVINLSKIFEEVEDITENTTILDDSVQIEYPAIFDVAENTVFDVIDIGDPEFFCRHCDAMMWYEERSEKSKTGSNIEFSICCMRGKVQLPFLQRPPQLLQGLLSGADQRSKHFKDNIRTYNSMFCFTSLGGKIETSINDGTGPPQFIVSGQNYHRIGSLVPIEGQRPKFAQLYIYDTENEVSNRIEIFSSRTNNNNIDQSLVLDLKDMIDQHNVLAHTFRIVRNYLNQGDIANIRLRLYRKRSKDARVYNLPSSNEVAALIVGDFDSGDAGRDIIVQLKSGHLQRIHETHTAFIPLQYPMMFPYSEDGYQEDIPLRESHRADENRKRQRVSLREFIAFRIQERKVEYATIVNGGRLFQQFLVDCFSMIEAQRLTYYRNNQTKVRSDIYKGIQDAVVRGETRASKAGKRIILPASFTGGMRYMFNNCQDAMAICKKYGYPDLFITMTCNSSWQEIGRVNNPRNLKVEDRPDISCRVFKIKLDMIISDLKQGIPFGVLDAGMYTVEFQKRGLPHAHILLWLSGDHKITTTTQIDQLISSELPDPAQHPKLFRAVSTYMIHGPCGRAFSKSPCMKDGYCTKYYPKTFSKTTVIDDSGYPSYRRRDTWVVTEKKGVHMDNRNVVPYNAYLLMSYQAHVNVEYCNKSNAIKYLFKYVNKGPDRVAVGVTKEASSGEDAQVIDEIKQFYDCRYLSACEAVWRTLAYDIHQRWPSVMRLTFHLPGEQNIIFKDDDDLEEIVEEEEGKCDIYYMRILLAVQRGCTTYESIRTVNGITYSSFQDACYSMGLLCDDREFIAAINEVAELASGHQLRKLFAMLLISNSISNPERVWNATWTLLANGILYERRKALKNQGLSMTDDELKNLCLIEIEKILNSNARSLRDYQSMPYPEMSHVRLFQNKLIEEELAYDTNELTHTNLYTEQKMTHEQRLVFDEILNAVVTDSGGFYFVYGHGGCERLILDFQYPLQLLMNLLATSSMAV